MLNESYFFQKIYRLYKNIYDSDLYHNVAKLHQILLIHNYNALQVE